MNADVAKETIPDIEAQARQLTKRQMQQWFDWMDHILDLHRKKFLFREPTPGELDEHKAALKLAIRTCLLINTLIADPDFNEPGLVSRLRIRIQQLQDAYDTFHDPTLSDAQAEEFLGRIFPE